MMDTVDLCASALFLRLFPIESIEIYCHGAAVRCNGTVDRGEGGFVLARRTLIVLSEFQLPSSRYLVHFAWMLGLELFTNSWVFH